MAVNVYKTYAMFQATYSWKFKPGLIPGSSTKTIKLRFPLQAVDFDEKGPGNYKENFEVSYTSDCDGGDGKPEKKTKTLSYKYESKLTAEQLEDDSGKVIEFDEETVKVSQTFKITNKGPSKIFENATVKIYVPQDDDLLENVSEKINSLYHSSIVSPFSCDACVCKRIKPD